MKSKKKLIYKLHQNINHNPFKQIDQVSFRNAGIGSYDFNKLKSIRAISLKGLAFDQINSQRQSDWKKKSELKMNMVSIKQEIQHKAHQSLICNKKKITVDKFLISMQPKKLNLRTLLKDKCHESHPESNQHKITPNMTEAYEAQGQENIKNLYQNLQNLTQQKYDLSDRPISRQNNQKGHLRNVSLPLINGHKKQTSNSLTFISPNKQLDLLVEEQRAKQQILKQIRLNAQEKINKQVLMSIKLKSIQNLERIARSQSEVIKIDKWKQKYGQLKNIQQLNLKEKSMSPRGFLPQIQHSEQKLKPSHRYMESNQEPEGQLEKSEIQHAKDLLYNVTVLDDFSNQEKLFSYNSALLYGKSYEFVHNQAQQKGYQLQHNYNSEILSKSQANEEYWYSQPLKITITKLKGHTNKQNQNLQTQAKNIQKSKKKIAKTKLQKGPQKNQQAQSKKKSQKNPKGLKLQTPNPFQDNQASKQQSLMSPTQFKTKSKLQTKMQKIYSKHDDPVLFTESIGFKSKKPIYPKCKINEQNKILNKIVDDGMPEEWEQKRMGDDELTDFDIFVQNEAKESEDL